MRTASTPAIARAVGRLVALTHPLHFAKLNFLGIAVTPLVMEDLLEAISAAIRLGNRLTISFLNPNYVLAALRSPSLKHTMNQFDVMLADGWGVVWGGRLLGLPIPTRMANDDIGRPLFDLMARNGWRVFLFGSAPGVPERAAERLRHDFPPIEVAGVQHGWLDVERGHPGWYENADTERVVSAINASRADLLVVGLPTPAQQRWVKENASRLSVPVIMTAGSYLDHVAERIDWYPQWVMRSRICWLYRLYRDPSRLWKRYSLELLRFGAILLQARLGVGQPGRA